jgi:MinD superfamily P-loop ATPase
MKELTVISGKGGTGKTSIVASLAALAENKVMADCDVDAADLHLLLEPTLKYREEFRSGKLASINRDICTECGKCIELCRFNAISDDFVIDPISCEGCGVCAYFCPEEAIELSESLSGEWFISDTRFGPLVHAKLGIAEENSGKLVTLVRKNARAIAEKEDRKFIIVDGPPGIGCPVIASITGVDSVLVVTEPTLSGIHDLERTVALAEHFKIPTMVCINKYDLNPEMSTRIERFCENKGLRLLGKIAFDLIVTKALVQRKSVVDYSLGAVTQEIKKIWRNITYALEL